MNIGIIKEFNNLDLGDRRLDNRGKKILDQFFQNASASIPETCQGDTEMTATYRFMNNDLVTWDKLLKPHREATIERIKLHDTVLMIQDTSDISMKHMESVENLGVVNDAKNPGCCIHPLVAFTPQRLCLGTVYNKIIIRTPEELGQKAKYDRPIEEKESFRWIEAYRAACEVSEKAPDTTLVCIGDRESDIYELILEASQQDKNVELLVRACHDRKIESETDTTKTRKELKKAPVKGSFEFEIPSQKSKKARTVKQEVKAKRITLVPTKKHLLPVEINAVLLEEVDVPEGEKPISWMFFTTLPISTEEELKTIVDYYLCRWGIEVFFHVLKNGCTIEKLQFKSAEALLPCIAMYMVVSWRLLYLLFLGRTVPDLPCSLFFGLEEWQSVYAIVKKKAPPDEPPSLGEMVYMVAKLGGYIGRKGDGPPGPKVMWRGVQKMIIYTEGWKAHREYTK